MKRWLLPAALLLSLGFNFGLVASYLMDRFAPIPSFEPRQVEPADVETSPEELQDVGALSPGEATTVASAAEAEAAVEPLVLVPEPETSEASLRAEGASSSSESDPQSIPDGEPQERASQEAGGQEGASQERPRADSAAPPARPGLGAARRLGQRTDFEQMADRLELSGEQREKFLADHLEFSSRVRRIAPRTLRLRRAFFSELSAAQPDEEKIKRLTQQLGAANVALERALADVVLKTRSHLDVQRQQEYLRYVQSRMQRLQEFMQRGGQRPRQGQGQGPRMRRRPNARPPGF